MPNVDVFPANGDVERVYAVTKILLAPSLLPETFGLVALEAGLRGIPCLSSDAGGLPEANAGGTVLETPLVWDAKTATMWRGASHARALRGAPGGVPARRAAPSAMTEAFARRFGVPHDRALDVLFVAAPGEVENWVDCLRTLLGDPAALAAAAAKARDAATRVLGESGDVLVGLLDGDGPPDLGDAGPRGARPKTPLGAKAGLKRGFFDAKPRRRGPAVS